MKLLPTYYSKEDIRDVIFVYHRHMHGIFKMYGLRKANRYYDAGVVNRLIGTRELIKRYKDFKWN